MTEKEYAKLIAKNLKRIAYEANKTQADISRDLKINKQTVSTWFRGERVPRMESIDKLCAYFGIKRTDIMEEQQKLVESTKTKDNVILVYFNALNEKGKDKAIDYLRDLSENVRYTTV